MDAERRDGVLQRAVEGLAATRTAVEQLSKKLESHDSKLDRLREEVTTLKTDNAAMRQVLDRIDTALHRGNGQPALMSRMLLMEKEQVSLRGTVGKLKGVEAEDRKAKASLWTATITGVLGFLTAVAVALMK